MWRSRQVLPNLLVNRCIVKSAVPPLTSLYSDHQLAPDVYSEVCRERQFERSLLERLQQRYGSEFPCAITLHENYRSHSDIVKVRGAGAVDGRLGGIGFRVGWGKPRKLIASSHGHWKSQA